MGGAFFEGWAVMEAVKTFAACGRAALLSISGGRMAGLKWICWWKPAGAFIWSRSN